MLGYQPCPHRQAFQDLLRGLADDDTFCAVTFASDLGQAMHYNRRLYRGPQADRHKLTLQKLKKIQKLELSIAQKAHLIMASCYPQALHGAHMYSTGQSFFRQLRTAVTDALIGQHRNSQPFLGTMLLAEGLIDPEAYVIRQSILAAKDFLWYTDEATVQSFLSTLATATKAPGQVTGPACALQSYLSKLGWQANSQGKIFVDGFYQLDLRFSSVKDITHAVIHSWMDHVSVMLSARKGMRNCPTIDRTLTIKVFQSQPVDRQHVLALQITGAFMTNAQKTHFVPGQDPACTFCNEPDSVEHQTLDCLATESIRLNHAVVVSELRERSSIHTLFPVIYRHPMFEYFRVLQYQMQFPDLDLQGHHPDLVFTDGSCMHPTLSDERWASYSIVFSHLSREVLNACPQDQIKQLQNAAFHTLAVGHVQGSQSVDRA